MQPADTPSDVGYRLGPYQARITRHPHHIRRAQALRSELFGVERASDDERFDPTSRHVLIEERETKALVGCFRIAQFDAQTINDSYAAQFYVLDQLLSANNCAFEIGRFCMRDALVHPDVVRFALGIIAREVMRCRVRHLFGCTSFPGTDPEAYAECFAYLAQRHGAAGCFGPALHGMHQTVPLSHFASKADVSRDAVAQLPGLLRTYLALGGRTGDHAIIDQELKTLHVFTAVDVENIPRTRRDTLLKTARRMAFFSA